MKYRFISLFVVVLLSAMSFATPQAQASCSQSGTNQQFELLVPNLTNETLSVYWKDFQCVEQLTDTIPPGNIFFQNTYDGHEWVVRDPSGNQVQSFTAQANVPTVVIGTVPFNPVPVTSNCSSAGTNTAMDLTVINNTDDPALLYWIDFSCNELFYAVIKAHDQYIQPSSVGHDWVVRYMDGRVVEQVTLSPAKNTVIIDPPPTSTQTNPTAIPPTTAPAQTNPTAIPPTTAPVQTNPTAIPQTSNTTALGRDVILRLDGQNYELGLINPDGTGVIPFNQGADSGRISRDGKHVVFYSNRDGDYEIFMMNIDGSNLQQLTNDAIDNVQPNFSPDGTRIIFSSNRDGNFEIYLMNTDGSNLQRLTNNSEDDRAPSISPDGSKIAFHHGVNGNAKIYIMNIDGTNMEALTNNGSGASVYPRFSPDGKRIVFHARQTANESYDIYVMDVDGRNQQQLRLTLAKEAGDYVFPFFSPDSGKIVYSFYPADTNLPTKIYILNADESEQFVADGVGADWFSDPSTPAVSQANNTPTTSNTNTVSPTSAPAVTTSSQFSGPAVQFIWNTDSFYIYNPGDALNIVSIRFEEVNGNGQSTGIFFEGSRWAKIYDKLQYNFCNEIEISGKTDYLNPSVCQGVNSRIGPSPDDPVIFWNNASIRVLWDGTEIGTCPVSAGSCTLNLP